MKRYILLVLAVEVLVGAFLVRQRLTSYRPPLPNFAHVDTLAAQQLRDQAARCRTTDEWYALGDAYMSVGYFPEAEACHRVAATERPKEAKYALAWAFALERLGQTSAANREYQRAIDLGHARKGDCRYYIGRNLLRDEQPIAAQRAFEAAIDTVPRARYELARLLFRANQRDDAQRVLQPLLTAYPDTIQPALLMHSLAHQQGDARRAFLYADRAMTATTRLLNPFDTEVERLTAVRAKLGLVGRWKEADRLIQNKRYAQAEPLLREGLAVQWHPTGADLLAEVEFQRGPKLALPHFREIIGRDGPSAYNVGRLADTLRECGQEEAARAEWMRAVKLGSAIEAKDMYYKLALSFEQAKDSANHKKFMAAALRCAAQEQLRLRSFADADGLLREAFTHEPNDATTWYLRGEVARRSNQHEAAIQAYRACLQANPDHGRAAAALAFLTK